MNILIVDDEPRAIELMERYIARFTDLRVAGTFRNGLMALEFLRQQPVDLILLDINMPHLSGLALSKVISPDIKVIFTTAHAEFAVESYEVNAVDYLLKPISFERFAKAMQKVLSITEPKQQVLAVNSPEHFIYLKSGSRLWKVNISDIDYLEKDGNYMTYYIGNQKIMARQTIKEALEILPEDFLQVHKSFIVSLRKIEFLDTHELRVPNRSISIGTQYKAHLLQRMGL